MTASMERTIELVNDFYLETDIVVTEDNVDIYVAEMIADLEAQQ